MAHINIRFNVIIITEDIIGMYVVYHFSLLWTWQIERMYVILTIIYMFECVANW